jgi:hypothetical protein
MDLLLEAIRLEWADAVVLSIIPAVLGGVVGFWLTFNWGQEEKRLAAHNAHLKGYAVGFQEGQMHPKRGRDGRFRKITPSLMESPDAL